MLPQVLKLLKQIQLQEAGEMEPPPISVPQSRLEDDDEEEEEDEEEAEEEEEEDENSSDAGETARGRHWSEVHWAVDDA